MPSLMAQPSHSLSPILVSHKEADNVLSSPFHAQHVPAASAFHASDGLTWVHRLLSSLHSANLYIFLMLLMANSSSVILALRQELRASLSCVSLCQLYREFVTCPYRRVLFVKQRMCQLAQSLQDAFCELSHRPSLLDTQQ